MLKRFVVHAGGAVAPLFAIAAIPMLGAVGAAVDFSRAYQERTIVQDALDAAALSGGRDIGVKTTEQIKVEVEKYYLANIGDKIANPPTLESGIAGGTVTINTTLRVPTYILRIMGLNEVVFHMTTQAKAGMGTLEVAMVLDNSTSMCLSCTAAQQNQSSTKIGALKVAATNLTDKLFALQATSTQPDPVKMALVPFGASVNVGPGSVSDGWVDTAGAGTYAGQAQKAEGAAASVNPYSFFDGRMKYSDNTAVTWGGCLEERPSPYDIDDTPPSGGTPGTLFVPMFAPDEPDNWLCSTTTCNFVGTTTGTRRYNGRITATGNQAYNNYLPDAGDETTCAGVSAGKTFTATKANPGVFTRNGHGLTAGTEIAFNTTGTLIGGMTAGQSYYVFPAGIAANTFMVSSTITRTTFTVSGNTFTRNSHGLPAGTALQFQSSGTLPSPLSASTTYYVLSSNLNTNNFRVSTSAGGTAVSVSGGSGTLSYLPAVNTNSGSQSGTHTYFVSSQAVNWTCENGNANCAGANNGRSQNVGLAGTTIAANAQCKYGTTANKATVQAGITVGNIKGGPNFMCSTKALTPLTTTKQTVIDAINAQVADGYTNITAGISWGFRVLSPGVPFTQGRDYTDINNLKVMIVMTDGENTYHPYMQADQNPANTTYAGKFVKSGYGAWGYLYNNRLGTTSTQSATVFSHLNARTAAACVAAKAANIKIYTIAFQVTDAATLQMLTDCASDPSMAYQSGNNQALLDAFTAIGESITSLRVSM